MNVFLSRLPLLAVLLLAFSASGSWAVLPSVDSEGRQLPSLAPMLKNVNPSVVNISTSTTRSVTQNPLMNDPFFRRFFNQPQGQQAPRTRRAQSAGSGVIIDAKAGTVITNHHVVKDVDEIEVTLSDDRTYKAELIGSDAKVDIAVLQLKDFNKLTDIALANSDQLQVGDFVVAIGNPFGIGQTVTSGIVSALGRVGLGIDYENFIQTDASINPGNSGGALVNLRGELVGINTAILAPAGGNVGIGFAIPVNMAKASIDQILEYGEVKRGQLGVMIQDLSADLAEAFGLDRQQQGVLITSVAEDSAAQKAGLEADDIVVSIDSKKLKNASQLRNSIGLKRIGDKVKLVVLRDGRRKSIVAKVGEAATSFGPSDSIHPFLAGAMLERNPRGDGVVVVDIDRQSPAASSGLMPGDIILGANRLRVSSVSDLQAAAAKFEQRLVLRVKRGGGVIYLVLQ
ncbi:MAG: serine protease DegQ [Paraglaciecola psychrophila]|jgi:serine protease DegQ